MALPSGVLELRTTRGGTSWTEYARKTTTILGDSMSTPALAIRPFVLSNQSDSSSDDIRAAILFRLFETSKNKYVYDVNSNAILLLTDFEHRLLFHIQRGITAPELIDLFACGVSRRSRRGGDSSLFSRLQEARCAEACCPSPSGVPNA